MTITDIPDLPPLSIDEKGWLVGESVVLIPSERSQRLLTATPQLVVNHWTSTGHGTAKSLAKRIVSAPRHGERAASWHLLLGVDTIYQSVSFLRGSWHAGGSTTKKLVRTNVEGEFGRAWKQGDSRYGANSLGIGMEIENVGRLRLVGEKWLGWPFTPGVSPEVSETEVVSCKGRHYHAFTPFQVDSAERVFRAIKEEYFINREDFTWTHQELDPTRKDDPGPVWTTVHLPGILQRVFE